MVVWTSSKRYTVEQIIGTLNPTPSAMRTDQKPIHSEGGLKYGVDQGLIGIF